MMNEHEEINRAVFRNLKRANRFDNYREIQAKFNSTATNCNHSIIKGDVIGWNKTHGTYCKDCWAKWVAENREADAIEQGYMPSVW